MWGEVEESVLRCVWGGEKKCEERCGGRVRKCVGVRGSALGVRRGVGGRVRKCVGVWGSALGVRKGEERCGEVCGSMGSVGIV